MPVYLILVKSCLTETFALICFPCQVQHNLFQSCAAASSRPLDDKIPTETFEPLYYVPAGQEDECLSPSSMKAHFLVDEPFSADSQSFKPRFYEIRPVLPGDELDKEVC